MSRFVSFLGQWLDGANPVFALTLLMANCRRIFLTTATTCAVVLVGILVATRLLPADIWLSTPHAFFEITFLIVICCAVVFLGSDFGSVFIESTFKDELFRLTPVTALQIVHGGILSSLFFSLLLLILTQFFLPVAWFLGLPVERIFWGSWLLFLIGQALNVVLLSSYINARSWRQIGFGATAVFLLILSFVGFCFTRLGQLLADPDRWPEPMLFLFAVSTLTFVVAYLLARHHARHPRRSFRRSIAINLVVYGLFWSVACFLAVTFSAS